MNLVFLHEPSQLDPGELIYAQAVGWRPATSLFDVQKGDLVYARHYAWPWERRLDADVARLGATLLNDGFAYRYAADPSRWAEDLRGLTPDTWVDFAQLPDDTAFIVKGSSADKGAWERMYAPTKSAAIQLRSLLQRDTGMRAQTLVARRYVPLERLGDGLGGCPVSTEFRVFVLDREVVGRGFYWPPEDCTVRDPPPASEIPADFLREALARVHPRLRFYALDVARTAAGDWIVIEVNDGQRSGLSEVRACELYPAMDRVLRRRGA